MQNKSIVFGLSCQGAWLTVRRRESWCECLFRMNSAQLNATKEEPDGTTKRGSVNLVNPVRPIEAVASRPRGQVERFPSGDGCRSSISTPPMWSSPERTFKRLTPSRPLCVAFFFLLQFRVHRITSFISWLRRDLRETSHGV